MKLFLTAAGKSMGDIIDPSFGRCNYFLIYETEDDSHEYIENPFQDAQANVSTMVAQAAIDYGCSVAIAVNPGPRAFQLFKEQGIEIYKADEGVKLRELVSKFSKNELTLIEDYIIQ